MMRGSILRVTAALAIISAKQAVALPKSPAQRSVQGLKRFNYDAPSFAQAVSIDETLESSIVGPLPWGGADKDAMARPAPLWIRPRFLFKFMAIGTAGFGIPYLLFPKLVHPILVNSGYPENTFYVCMFALRELWVATAFRLISGVPSSNMRTWQIFSLCLLGSQTIMNIFHTGWNPLFQPPIILIHLSFFILHLISVMKNVDPDEN